MYKNKTPYCDVHKVSVYTTLIPIDNLSTYDFSQLPVSNVIILNQSMLCFPQSANEFIVSFLYCSQHV